MPSPNAPWWERLLHAIISWFMTQTGHRPPTTPPPDPPVPGPAPVDPLRFPSGPIKTRGPNGRALSHISWQTISRWAPLFRDAVTQEGRGKYSPLLLALFPVIESDGQHFTNGTMRGRDDEVIRGHGDPRSRGLLQIRHDLHDPQMRALQPEAHIRLGARLMADFMDRYGPWEEALRRGWHPGTDPVSKTTTEEYIRTIRDLIAEVKASWSPPQPSPSPTDGTGSTSGEKYAVAGLPHTIALPLPAGTRFRQSLTPYGQNRSGKKLNWTGVTQHTTNNQNGMGAGAHANWQRDGTPGNPGVGVHFYVDDKEVVQTIPVNEQGVHSGDWRNNEHVAVELCVRPNGQTASPKAEANSIALVAGLLKHLGKTGTEALHPHTRNASGHCPRLSMSWPEWESAVDKQIERMS